MTPTSKPGSKTAARPPITVLQVLAIIGLVAALLVMLDFNRRQAEAQRLAAAEAYRPFDLARGPLLRARLLRLSDEDHVALLTMHHIVVDGWSMSVLIKEVSTLYRAYVQGNKSPLAELPIQYADYAAWQQQWLAGEVLEGRPRGDVGLALRERFGGEAFAAGHVSLMVDLGRLRADLQAPEEVPGVPRGQLQAAQAFTGALLDQLTPLDSGFLDFSLAEGGARLKGRVSLRGTREVSR